MFLIISLNSFENVLICDVIILNDCPYDLYVELFELSELSDRSTDKPAAAAIWSAELHAYRGRLRESESSGRTHRGIPLPLPSRSTEL